ncbi:MAG: hypothetical protein IT424_04510 [Pirellulales bacterium]|nr:hypothetical protein [Pirellulales bacterium]
MDNEPKPISTEDQIAILERFVVDNDGPLDLESHIGRFNIFDELRMDRAEIRHAMQPWAD